MASRNGSYTTSDLSRKSGDIFAVALRHPVRIAQRNEPRLVILNIDDCARLMRGVDVRTVGTIDTIDTIDDVMFVAMKSAVERYANEDELGQ